MIICKISKHGKDKSVTKGERVAEDINPQTPEGQPILDIYLSVQPAGIEDSCMFNTETKNT